MYVTEVFHLSIKKLFHPLDGYPKELKTKWAKVGYLYQWHQYVIDKGRGEVFGKVSQLFTETSLLLLVIDKIGLVKLSLPLIGILLVLGVCMVWSGGWLYLYLRMDMLNYILSRNRDPMFKKMYNKIDKGMRR